MERAQKRRRKTCPKCGKSFSYSWSRFHVKECGLPIDSEPADGGTIDMELPPNIPKQFSELIEKRRFEEEDVSFFDSDDNEEDIQEDPAGSQEMTQPPPTETWDDEDVDSCMESDDDIMEDLEPDNINNDTGDDHSEVPQEETSTSALSTKINALVLWLALFITTWQSNFGISDSAVSVLIKFLCKFFWLIGTFDTTISTLEKLFPGSFLGPCGEFLLKTVRSGGKTRFYPRMVYPYQSLIGCLQDLLKKPGFWKECQKWRHTARPANIDIKTDIYDGNVWKELATSGFLSSVNSLGLMLNVDWFQPHKHSPGSVGVIYLVVMDLPRHERYKLENVIIAGILPGPSEPKLTANTFLKPLVEELKQLWNTNIRFSVAGSLLKKPIKVGLVCVTCDIPAIRKIGGFMGHMANQGCSRCKKNLYIDGNLDFSGFDRSEWQKRTSAEHKVLAKDSLFEVTPTMQQSVCSKHGARYSVLQDLEYFDCIRYFVIDPMHNLYLGTAKHIFKKVWCNPDAPLLGQNELQIIQERVDSMVVPQDIGRIPGKIANNFSGFTADQWQNWVVVYSLNALQGILPDKHLDCWKLFAKACKILSKKCITTGEIEEGDNVLIQFLKKAEDLYGSNFITPNMHLHGHLKECLLDYGPFHGFWCYSFERYNGVLGAYTTNNKSLEVQLMRKVLAQIKPKSFTIPSDYEEEFKEFFSESKMVGSLKTTLDPIVAQSAFQMERTTPVTELQSCDWTRSSILEELPPIKDHTIDSDDLRYLKVVYAKLLGLTENDILDIPYTVAKFGSVKIGSTLFGSMSKGSCRNSYFLASWAGSEGRMSIGDCDEGHPRPGEVQFYFRHRVKVRSSNPSFFPESKTHLFHIARVNWFAAHPNRHAFGNSLEIWCDYLDAFGPCCFIPIQRFHSRFAMGKIHYNKEKVMTMTTLPGD